MSDCNRLEVYNFQGNDEEEVPENVEKLIVGQGVQVLPDSLCQGYQQLRQVTLPNGLRKIGESTFQLCKNLAEMKISYTVDVIGREAFQHCFGLKKVDFELPPASSSHRQQIIIGEFAFCGCENISRIKLPSFVKSVGIYAFLYCFELIEANLSSTSLTEISDSAFEDCPTIQTISLPNTLEEIGFRAFNCCKELVTVILPLDSRPIKIGNQAFGENCNNLANLALPKGSTAEGDSFEGCGLLHEVYGEDSTRIVAGLVGRFEKNPFHRWCYDENFPVTDEEMDGKVVLLDMFGMTPFHILFSTIDPSKDLLECFLKVLLDKYPFRPLNWRDATGGRPLYYLAKNWTDKTGTLVHMTLEKTMLEPISRWGATSWVETIQAMVQELFVEDDIDRRISLCDELYSAFEHFEDVQITSILEMAMWKWKLKSGRANDGAKRQALDRDECRCLNGADVVIPQVMMMLGIPRTKS